VSWADQASDTSFTNVFQKGYSLDELIFLSILHARGDLNDRLAATLNKQS
jgi:hypothetical protein